MLNSVIAQLAYWITVIFVCYYSFRFGGQPERAGAAIVIAASVLSVIVSAISRTNFHSVDQGLLLVDIATWALLMFLVLSTNRFWPLWATAFHSISLLTHAVILLDSRILPAAYAVGQTLWAYPVLAALLVGSERYRRRPTPRTLRHA